MWRSIPLWGVVFIFLNDHRTYILCEVHVMFKQMFLNKLPVPEVYNYKCTFALMYIVHYKSISVNACSIHVKNQVSSKSTVSFSEFKLNWFKSFFYLINMGNGISIMIILKKFGNIELCILQLFIYTFAFVYYSAIVTMQIVCLIKIVDFFFLFQ